MYESYFQFHSRPFAAAPALDLYFPASSIECAYHTLVRCVARGEGPAYVMGGAGTGKSMLCHLLAERFIPEFDVVQLNCAQLTTPRTLLQAVLFELSLPYRGMEEGELRLSLIDFLKPKDDTQRGGLLLLVDEAHSLSLELLEEIRMLTNVIVKGEPRVRLVLAGGPKLEEVFTDPKLESFNQRIAARCYLHPLTYDETLDYVTAQISAVGGNPVEIITEDAQQAVYHASDGIPRLINQVCDHALMLAVVAEQQIVDRQMIEQAWADLQQLPPPCRPAASTSGPVEDVVEFGSLDEPTIGEDPTSGEAREPIAPDWDDAPIDLTEQLDRIQLRVASLDDESDGDEPDGDELETPVTAPVADEDAGIESAPWDASEPELSAGLGETKPHAPMHAVNPFDACYEQEEVIVDRYAALDAKAQGYSVPGEEEVAFAPPPIAAPASVEPPDAPLAPGPGEQVTESVEASYEESDEGEPESDDVARVSVMREPPDDSDLIVLVGEDMGGSSGQPAGRAYRQEYNQLFSRLRRT